MTASTRRAVSPFEVSGLVVGGHEFAVRATDAAGNTDATPAVHTWSGGGSGGYHGPADDGSTRDRPR